MRNILAQLDDQIEVKYSTVKKLKIQLLKKIEIQNSSASRKIDSGKSYCEKPVQFKSGEFNNSTMEIKGIEKEKRLLEKENEKLAQFNDQNENKKLAQFNDQNEVKNSTVKKN